MEARRAHGAVLFLFALLGLGASHRTPNFVVTAPTDDVARQVGQAAEKYRRDLAMAWLGKTLPNWAQPCPIEVNVGPMGAGGATSFVFDHGEVFSWNMSIQGSLERILDSVLPHEVSHTVFASHFRQPLPRWADEGACTTVETISERQKQQRMLINFLRERRGIPFHIMFAMKEYPQDILPLYAQGHSLASYLIAQGGRRKYVEFVGDGLENEAWMEAIKKHYGYISLAGLQDDWLNWVKQGSPSNVQPRGTDPETLLASNTAGASTATGAADELVPVSRAGGASGSGIQLASATANDSPYERARAGKWQAAGTAQSRRGEIEKARGGSSGATADQAPANSVLPSPVSDVARVRDSAPELNQVTRPQPFEPAKQRVLEWNHSQPYAPGGVTPAAIPTARMAANTATPVTARLPSPIPESDVSPNANRPAILDASLGTQGTRWR